MNIDELLVPLFEKAKEIDEFEFCCTLLRIRGLEGPGWDPLLESSNFLHQFIELINETREEDQKLRLILSLYCHATEIDDIYIIIGNLLRITKGERCSTTPFFNERDENNQKIKYPNQKINKLNKWAKDTDFENITQLMDSFLVKNVRNAFYHSDYILYKDSFNIRHGNGVLIDGIIDSAVPLDWLEPKMELAINFSVTTIELIPKYIQSYTEEKILPARIRHDGGIENVQLIIDSRMGLRGFQSLPIKK